jgi:uncharacterized protein with HEPN domain
MPEEERLRLLYIIERIETVERWVEGVSMTGFLDNGMLHDASSLAIMVIGETGNRLLPATKSAMSDIPWGDMTGLRNRIAHGYPSVDHELVWKIIDLPTLKTACRRVLAAA